MISIMKPKKILASAALGLVALGQGLSPLKPEEKEWLNFDQSESYDLDQTLKAKTFRSDGSSAGSVMGITKS